MEGSRFVLVTPEGEVDVALPLGGDFNIDNALVAAGCALSLSIPLESIASGLRDFRGVPGRFEVISADAPVTVLVDYAHTPASIANAIASVRRTGRGVGVGRRPPPPDRRVRSGWRLRRAKRPDGPGGDGRRRGDRDLRQPAQRAARGDHRRGGRRDRRRRGCAASSTGESHHRGHRHGPRRRRRPHPRPGPRAGPGGAGPHPALRRPAGGPEALIEQGGSKGDLLLVAAAVSLVVSIFGTPYAIRLLRRRQIGQFIQDDIQRQHAHKQGTPTMGGVVFVLACLIGYFVAHVRVWTPSGGFRLQLIPFGAGGLLAVMALVGMAIVGFVDDYIKFTNRRSLGLSKGAKFGAQLGIAILFAIGAANADVVTEVSFVRPLGIDLGAFFFIWVLIMLTAPPTA